MVPVKVTATFSQEWDEAEGHVSILRGQCRIVQGSTLLQAQQMVVWRTTQSGGRGKRDRLTVYLEDDVRIEEPGSTHNESPTLVTLNTRAGVTVTVSNASHFSTGSRGCPLSACPRASPTLDGDHHPHDSTDRACPRASGDAQRSVATAALAQFVESAFVPVAGMTSTCTAVRRTNRTPPEQVTILTGGVTVLIEGLDQRVGGKPVGTIELSADRMVIWSRGELAGSRDREDGTVQSEDEPFDVYLEGNVVIFQGDPTNPQLMRKVRLNTRPSTRGKRRGCSYRRNSKRTSHRSRVPFGFGQNAFGNSARTNSMRRILGLVQARMANRGIAFRRPTRSSSSVFAMPLSAAKPRPLIRPQASRRRRRRTGSRRSTTSFSSKTFRSFTCPISAGRPTSRSSRSKA